MGIPDREALGDTSSPTQWARIEPLLDAALDMPETERPAYLARECAGDPALREEVERLLVSRAKPHEELDRWAGIVDSTLLEEHAPPPLALPSLLASRYRIGREIGRGGMAVVYLAHDERLDRPVAIKVLHPETATRIGARRFSAEIRLTANLRHPNIIPLFDSGEADGWTFFVMPYIDGESARDRLQRTGALAVPEAVRIITDVLAALTHAHDAGVVHRDIKPSNIMLARDSVSLADFGIARQSQERSQGITDAGMMVGTPAYMSPEQVSGWHPVGVASDIYSVGCVLYELLTGSPPVSAAIRLHRAATGKASLVASPADHPELAPSLLTCIEQAMALEPADRYASAAEFSRALPQPSHDWARPTGAPPSRVRWGVLASFAVILLAGAFYVTTRRPATPSAPSWLLVSRVETSAPEQELGAAIEELLRSEFSQSPSLAVVSSDQVRRALRASALPDTTTLNSQRAREVAMRSDVKVFVSATVHRLAADRISLTVSLVDAADGLTIANRASTLGLGDNELLRGIARITRELRAELGDRSVSRGPGEQHAFVSTPSFAAFKLYSDAMRANWRGNVDGSTHLLLQAVALDTAFAEAWGVIAGNYVTLRQPDSARLAFARAIAHAERLPAPEADRLRGDEAFQTGYDPASAVRWYGRYLEQRPLSANAWNNLALCMSALGRHEEALQALERAFAIDPFNLGPQQIELLNYAAELVVVGKSDSARRVAARLTGPDAQYMDLMLLNATDQWDSLAVLAERVADAPETEGYVRASAHLHAIGARVAMGDTARAILRLGRIIAAAHGGTQRLYVHAQLLFDLTRRVRPAWPLPASMIADSSVGGVFTRAVYAAQRGDLERAERERSALLARGPLVVRSLGAGLPYLDYLMAAGADTLATGARIVELATAGEHDPLAVDRPSSIALRWLAAQVLSASGRTAQAERMRAALRAPLRMPPQHYPLRGLVMRAPAPAMSR